MHNCIRIIHRLFYFILAETRFLHAIFDNHPLSNIHFCLSPAYTFYMALRYRLSNYRQPIVMFSQKEEDVCSLLYRIEDMINKKIEVNLSI